MGFKKKEDFSDELIIAGIKAGGSEGQRITNHLFDKHAGLVFQGMKKYRLTEEHALDVYGDTIIAIGSQIKNGKFRGESKLSTYLFRIFNNRCLNKVRDLKTKQLDLVDEMPDYPEAGKTILQSMIHQETFDALLAFMDKLGERCKEIILLADYYGFSMDEIAEKIGFQTGRSVSAQKSRCRSQLKTLIAETGGMLGIE